MLPQQAPIIVQRQHSTRHQRQPSSSSSSSKPPASSSRPPTIESSTIGTREPESQRLTPAAPVVISPAAVPLSRPSGHSRRASDMSEATSTVTTSNGTPVHAPSVVPEEGSRSGHHTSSQRPRKTSIHGSSGTWILGKTIGAGSMGKVKLARKSDGSEQVRTISTPEHSFLDFSHYCYICRSRSRLYPGK